MFHDNSLKMKKATLILLASAVIAAGSVTLSSCGGGSEGENYIVEVRYNGNFSADMIIKSKLNDKIGFAGPAAICAKKFFFDSQTL